MEKKTEKITVSLPPEVIRLADQNWEKFGFKNRSELIDAAIREYISRDLLKEFTGELSQFYQKIERSEIKHLEEHLAKLSYKIAVEIAQTHLLMASITDLSKRDTRDLRARAVALVNESKGYISLDTESTRYRSSWRMIWKRKMMACERRNCAAKTKRKASGKM